MTHGENVFYLMQRTSETNKTAGCVQAHVCALPCDTPLRI